MGAEADNPVLCVDDDVAVLRTISFVLSPRVPLLTATSGEQALKLLEENDVSVLVADQRLPGMTGVEICEAARRIRPDAVRVILTAYADIRAAEAAINEGQVALYLAKPFGPEALVETVEQCRETFRQRRQTRELRMDLLHAGPPRVAQAVSVEVFHEVRNFVAAAQLASEEGLEQLLPLMDEVDPSVAGRLEIVVEAQREVLLALEQLRAMTERLGPARARTRACRVEDVVRTAAQIVRARVEKVADLIVGLEAGAAEVPIDASELAQVVVNLLLNASEALSDLGHRGRVRLHVQASEHEVHLSVDDDGPGIPEELRDDVFRLRFTTKREGSGVGLAVSRDVARAAGGTLRVDRSSLGGARFVLVLPRIRAG